MTPIERHQQTLQDFDWLDRNYPYGDIKEFTIRNLEIDLWALLRAPNLNLATWTVQDWIGHILSDIAPRSLVANNETWCIADRQGCLPGLEKRAEFLGVEVLPQTR